MRHHNYAKKPSKKVFLHSYDSCCGIQVGSLTSGEEEIAKRDLQKDTLISAFSNKWKTIQLVQKKIKQFSVVIPHGISGNLEKRKLVPKKVGERESVQFCSLSGRR